MALGGGGGGGTLGSYDKISNGESTMNVDAFPFWERWNVHRYLI